MITVYKLFGLIPILAVEYWGFEQPMQVRNTTGQYELALPEDADDDEYYEDDRQPKFGFGV